MSDGQGVEGGKEGVLFLINRARHLQQEAYRQQQEEHSKHIKQLVKGPKTVSWDGMSVGESTER